VKCARPYRVINPTSAGEWVADVVSATTKVNIPRSDCGLSTPQRRQCEELNRMGELHNAYQLSIPPQKHWQELTLTHTRHAISHDYNIEKKLNLLGPWLKPN
jgi:hypothetical protein